MIRLILLFVLLAVNLTACGPLIGQAMKLDEGTRIERVVSGNLADLQGGGHLLVFGPFAKTSEAFYICRGEEAASFAEQMGDKGFFKTELNIMPGFAETSAAVARLKGQSPSAIKKELGLSSTPEMILFGTILKRSMNVAPTRGVVQDVTYRLEFYDLKTHSSTTVDVKSKLLYRDCIPAVVDTLMEQSLTSS